MREVNLAGIDLNLLTALEALLTERNVTRAAERIGLSQPAMSRALGRLRALLGDRVLVRGGDGLVPTPRALALAEPLARILAGVRGMLRPPDFNPAEWQGQARIICPDVQSLEMLPSLMRRLRASAPLLDLHVVASNQSVADALIDNEADLAAGRVSTDRPGLYAQTAYRTGFACVVRADHPVAIHGLTVQTYIDLPHILISVTGRGGGRVDEVLEGMGLSRRIALRLPHFLAAPLIVAETDLILTLPVNLARRMARLAPLAVLEPPIPLGDFEIGTTWHERWQDDAAHGWLRREVAAALAEGPHLSIPDDRILSHALSRPLNPRAAPA